jgi:Heparan-alpha-glucosaminide N-acetyltransferase, catalytic
MRLHQNARISSPSPRTQTRFRTIDPDPELRLPMTAIAGEAAPVSDRRAYRMTSIDILRGLVIVVMALDHVRDYVMVGSMQDPTADPTTGPLLFATRWITHFCAPTFVFLSGVSAGLMAQRKSPSSLARFLLLRGLWLVVVEVLVVSTAASFAPMGIAELGGRTYVGLQVIWAIGASMLALGRRAVSWAASMPRHRGDDRIRPQSLGHGVVDRENTRHSGAPVDRTPCATRI